MQIANFIRDFRQIVLIDDDAIHNMITKKVLQNFYHPAPVTIATFDDPKQGLEYIQNQVSGSQPLLIFLDLKMPVLSGWDVLEELSKTTQSILENMTLYLLTSSIDDNDKQRAKQYSLVNGFLAKPLTSRLSKPV